MRTKISCLTIFILAFVIFAAPSFAEVVRDSKTLLGTTVTIMTWESEDDPKVAESINAAFAEIERIQKVFSEYIKDSTISKINNAAGRAPVKVTPEVMEMLKKGIWLAEKTSGAFDPTFAGAGALYDFKAKDPILPSKKKLKEALAKVGIKHLRISEKSQTAMLDVSGAKLGLGGYIKGYAVDRASNVLRERGYTDFIVNGGGDIMVAGNKGKRSWRIGVQDPRGPNNRVLATIQVKDKAVVTSGDYERFFIKDGIRYHHIIDPNSGLPGDECRSVTIVADSTMMADAFATAVFVLGPIRGLELVETLPDVEAFVIDARGKWSFSSGFLKACIFKPVNPR